MSDQELLDLLNEEDEHEDDDLHEDDDFKKLQTELELLKKENKGLLQAKQEEKRKRQANQEKLNSIESKLNNILDSRNKNTPDKSGDSDEKSRIPVEFTEDGFAFIPQEKLNEWATPYQQKIQELEAMLEATTNNTLANQKAEDIKRNILSEDERYPAVYNKYLKAREWVNDKVIEYQKDNNLRGQLTAKEALNLVFNNNETLENEFSESFTDMDLYSVVIAEDAPILFRKMLKNSLVSDSDLTKNKNDDKERFDKVLKKPSNLHGVKNSKAQDLNVLDTLESLSQDDILSLSDDRIKAIERALKEEELKS